MYIRVTYGDIICEIMGKRHSIIEIFALVRCRAALVDVCYRCFGKTCRFHLHGWSSARRMAELVYVKLYWDRKLLRKSFFKLSSYLTENASCLNCETVSSAVARTAQGAQCLFWRPVIGKGNIRRSSWEVVVTFVRY